MYYVLVNEVNNKIHKKQFTVHVLLTKNVHLYILIWAQICTFLFKNELCRSCWSRFLVWVKRCDFIQAFVSHNHPYISSSGMADDTLFYCYLCRDGCVKRSHYVAVLVYALYQPVTLPFLVCELCLPVASSTHPYIFLISARNLFHKFNSKALLVH